MQSKQYWFQFYDSSPGKCGITTYHMTTLGLTSQLSNSPFYPVFDHTIKHDMTLLFLIFRQKKKLVDKGVFIIIADPIFSVDLSD